MSSTMCTYHAIKYMSSIMRTVIPNWWRTRVLTWSWDSGCCTKYWNLSSLGLVFDKKERCYFNFIQSCQIWCVYFKNIKRNIHQKFVLVSGLEKNTHQDSFSHLGLTKNLFPFPACLFLLRCLLFTKESSNQKTYFPGVDKIWSLTPF